MSNKKRKYVDSDDEDLENVNFGAAPAGETYLADKGEENEDEGPRPKKVKMAETNDCSPQKKTYGGSRIPKSGGATPKGKGKGVLSLSRLNMLARPKDRR